MQKSKIAVIALSVTTVILLAAGVFATVAYVTTNKSLTSQMDKTTSVQNQLDGANAQLEALGVTNTQLEGTNSELKTNLTAAQAAQAKATAQLAKVNADIKAAQAKLDKANRGVVILSSINSNYNQFNSNIKAGEAKQDAAFAAWEAGDEAGADALFAQADAYFQKASKNSQAIIAALTKFNAGKY